jgi:hypothetical protein
MIYRKAIVEKNYDSVLHAAQPGKPAQLVIRMKVQLLPRDPAAPQVVPGQPNFTTVLARDERGVTKGVVQDANGMPFRCKTWVESEFNTFCIKFKKMVELSWNNQLILLPPDGTGYIGEMSDEAYRDFISSAHVPAHVTVQPRHSGPYHGDASIALGKRRARVHGSDQAGEPRQRAVSVQCLDDL